MITFDSEKRRFTPGIKVIDNRNRSNGLVLNIDLPAAKKQLTMVGGNLCFIMSKNESSNMGTDTDDCPGRPMFIHMKRNFT